jgi:NTP pyrophosphatase (non-canonical NTP hydrolase)
MTFNEYQDKAGKTALYPKDQGLTYTILGLNGEAGELAEKYKKIIRDCKGVVSEEQNQAMLKELGDVLWYVAMCAKELGHDLESVAQLNLVKLSSRKDRDKLHGSGDNR